MPDISRRLPPLNTLLCFDAAVRLGSFTRAADDVALSQASVSRRIRELEQDLGVALFERRRYDVAPTDAGERFGAVVRAALQDLAAAAEQLRAQASGEERLTIFSDMGLGAALVAPCVGEMQRLRPRLTLRLLASYEPIESVGDAFDVGLQCGRWAERLFDVEPLADDVVFPVCAPGMARALGASPHVSELVDRPLLHLADLGRSWPDWRSFLASFGSTRPPHDERLTFNAYQICLDVAEQGDGIALGWGRTVQDRLDAGRLARVPGFTMPIAQAINIYRRKGAAPNPTADLFIALLRAKTGVASSSSAL